MPRLFLRTGSLFFAALFLFNSASAVQAQPGQIDRWNPPIRSSKTLRVSNVTLKVDFAEGPTDLPVDQILPWVRRAAEAVVTYYGRFPVPRARIIIVPVAGRHSIMGGTTWGDMNGFPGFTKIELGEHATERDLAADWTLTHEMVHMAFPSLLDDQHWMEEGLATYVEPIARVEAGQLTPNTIWRDMIAGMPKGEPESGDRGMDRTPTWGRTYWGGALFCLVADVAIRKQTNNRKGLQDALRAIVNAGGTIDNDWPLKQALEIGDKATGTTILRDQYKVWSNTAVPVDLDKLWRDLGIHPTQDGITLDDNAPLASIRKAITSH